MKGVGRKSESPKDAAYMRGRSRLHDDNWPGLCKSWYYYGAHNGSGIRLADGILKKTAIRRRDKNGQGKNHILIACVDALG